DSESIYTKVFTEICAEYDKQYTWEVKVKQMGQSEINAFKVLLEMLQLPLTVEEFKQKCDAKLKVQLPSALLLPGAEKLVRHLHKHGVPMALASGSNSHSFELKTRNHRDLFSLFGHTVLSSSDPEVKHGKPAPDCFLVAAARFDPPPKPENVLVFEDAPNGVEAGHAAGMQVVWVPDPRADRSVLADKATVILDSLVDFKPEEFSLPPYDS
ncbi:pseudouridine-5'-phosphatase-like, partial [Babylonia areolata]|uniref:pseudouridine-5'-phosphatase-like n=1 Tax=Babylonia areolata TaxID=304850 RepID=UPI003FCF6D3E